MTKDEIYEAELGLLSIRPTSTVKQCALIAMDVYAKQQAIAFAKYVIVDVYKMNSISASPFVSDEDVYGHFIKKQQNR